MCTLHHWQVAWGILSWKSDLGPEVLLLRLERKYPSGDPRGSFKWVGLSCMCEFRGKPCHDKRLKTTNWKLKNLIVMTGIALITCCCESPVLSRLNLLKSENFIFGPKLRREAGRSLFQEFQIRFRPHSLPFSPSIIKMPPLSQVLSLVTWSSHFLSNGGLVF